MATISRNAKNALEKIYTTVDAYINQKGKAVADWEQMRVNGMYSDEYKVSMIQKADAAIDFLQASTLQNVRSSFEQIGKQETAKHDLRIQSVEHQTAVANAMKFMELLGKSITEKQMQGIANPFIAAGDVQTLSVLRAIYNKATIGKEVDLRTPTVDFGEDADTSLNLIARFKGMTIPMLTSTDKRNLSYGMALHYMRQFLGNLTAV